jgi:3-oxoacyl-[acyl-carrier protein] reductase
MDLGIRGRKAIVCAASKGLGRGCAEALAEAGVEIFLNARSPGPLEETAAAIRARWQVGVTTIAADIATDAGRDRVIAACPDPDILVNNSGGPPPGTWSDWGREAWAAAIEENMLSPILLTTSLLPGMLERGWGRVVSITSQSVKAPMKVLGLSNGARAGLTGFIGGTARQVAASGVIMNNLLPGIHDTERGTSLDLRLAQSEAIPLAEARARREATLPVGRYGTPEEFGKICAFLCSQHVGFLVGQNILVDGGANAILL